MKKNRNAAPEAAPESNYAPPLEGEPVAGPIAPPPEPGFRVRTPLRFDGRLYEPGERVVLPDGIAAKLLEDGVVER